MLDPLLFFGPTLVSPLLILESPLSISAKDVGWKRNHCNAKQFSKLNKSAQNIQPRNMKKEGFQTNFKPLSGTRTNTYFISLSMQLNADSISVKILNYAFRNRELTNKRFSTVLPTVSVWDREILTDNLLFILIFKNFPEHVWTQILYHSLCNKMQMSVSVRTTLWLTTISHG